MRDYEAADPRVRETYRLNHRHQTVDFVRRKKEEYLGLGRSRMTVWEALASLDELVDESDPDTSLSQTEHHFQTAESMRAASLPDWMIAAGLVHDLGKVLCLYGEPQWAVVGDTFPVGCGFAPEVVHADLFDENPDAQRPEYSSPLGLYEEGCGLDRVEMSWGHDEYLFHVVRNHLPAEAAYVIRYHSFYAAHSSGAYDHLLSEYDRAQLRWVRTFSAHDLYSKADAPPPVEALRETYTPLVETFFPDALRW